MFRWSKRAAKTHEALWQERVSDLPGAVISEAFCAAERILVEVYTETEEEALLLQACYGGKVDAVKTVDWVAQTAPENTPPLIIRRRLVISADDSHDVLTALHRRYPGRIIITVPAERAFGTGNHATTSTCLRMLCDEAERRNTPWKLADIGCGTGVLALAGLRLGAASAVAFDFDPIAVEIARRNIERNGGAENLELFRADVFQWIPSEEQRADVVLANLFSTVLQQAFPKLLATMRPQARLIISGILNTQAEETLAAAEQAGLRLLLKVKRGKWVTAKLCRANEE